MKHLIDIIIFFQIAIRVRDAGVPVLEAQTTATVNVARNPSIPRFSNDTYYAYIKEDHEPGTSVVQTTATDADGVSLTLTLTLTLIKPVNSYMARHHKTRTKSCLLLLHESK